MKNIIPVILCGGSGTRLWPLSRSSHPKQFIRLNGVFSLFQNTIKRLLKLNPKKININEIIIVTNEIHRFLVIEQLKDLEIKCNVKVILEPTAKNTAPALTLAALSAQEDHPDSILIVSPADHHIENRSVFRNALMLAVDSVEKNSIVTLGIKPKYPGTGFGYIKYDGNLKVKRVLDFKEKPDTNQAEKFIKSGQYAWNTGIFITNSSTWVSSLQKTNKKMYESVFESFKLKDVDDWFIRPNKIKFNNTPPDSIDYAVIEKFKDINLKILLIELNARWDDVGSFFALKEFLDEDKNNNFITGDVEMINSADNIVFSSKKNISLVGISDLIIVETSDAVLIANKNDAQNIKFLVDKIKKKNKKLVEEHTKIHRPWGWFETIEEGKNFKVKRIFLNPMATLSYQSHKFRNEHWVVVYGRATIIVDEQEFTLNVDESTYIKKGQKHQLQNTTNKPVEIIEVQTGKKITEDDIFRYKDVYGR